MYKDTYKKELNALNISENFRKQMIDRLYQETLSDPLKHKRNHVSDRCATFTKSRIAIAAAFGFCMVAILASFIVCNRSNPALPNASAATTTEKGTTTSKPYILPLLSLSSKILSEGYGFGGILAYNYNEFLGSTNPWTKDVSIPTLPVYKNKTTDITLKQTVERVAEKLNIPLSSLNYTSDSGLVSAKADGVELNADAGKYWVNFDNPSSEIALSFFGKSKSGDESEPEGHIQAIKRFLQNNSFFQLKAPAISVGGGYTDAGEKVWSYSVYDSEGSLENKIVKSSLNNIGFFFKDNELSGFGVNQTDSYDLVGHYPIITVNEAQKLLLNGSYCTMSENTPSAKNIRAVTLTYVTKPDLDYLMPYYQFIVEDVNFRNEYTQEIPKGLKEYDIYYVPAIPSRYFTNYDSLKLRLNQ